MAKESKVTGDVFGIRKAVDLSDGIMKYEVEGKEYGVEIYESGNRAVQSYDSKDQSHSASNIVYGEKARIPEKADKLIIEFTGKVSPIAEIPDAIDRYHAVYVDKIKELKASNNQEIKDAFMKLTKMMAFNIAAAKWGWRNFDVAKEISVEIEYEGNELSFTNVKTVGMVGKYEDDKLILNESLDIEDFAERIYQSLISEDNVLIFNVRAVFNVGNGSRVYPSQLFPAVKKKVPGTTTEFSCELYRATTFGEDEVAGLSPEKIWNKIRTVDMFHGKKGNTPIPLEPNGATLQFQDFFRGGKSKNDFYEYKRRWLEATDLEEFIDSFENKNDLIFFLGILVRGGVLGSEKSK